MNKAFCVLCIVSMTGCATFSAFQGTPDIVSLKIGMHKSDVEKIVDDVSTFNILEDGQTQIVYSYLEKEPSPARGIGYFFLSAITLFLAEPALLDKEVRRSHKNYATIVYDKNDRVVSLKTQQGVLPLQQSVVDFTYREQQPRPQSPSE